jgi:nitroreductase
MLGHPAAIIVICIDWERVEQLGAKRHHRGVYIDVGTAVQNMLLAAEAMEVGAGPVTSFSKTAVRQVLGLPESMQPELAVCLGRKATVQPFGPTLPHKPTHLEDLVVRSKFVSDH